MPRARTLTAHSLRARVRISDAGAHRNRQKGQPGAGWGLPSRLPRPAP
jgi:hypothetical protein